jgi:hypothetical protein
MTVIFSGHGLGNSGLQLLRPLVRLCKLLMRDHEYPPRPGRAEAHALRAPSESSSVRAVRSQSSLADWPAHQGSSARRWPPVHSRSHGRVPADGRSGKSQRGDQEAAER